MMTLILLSTLAEYHERSFNPGKLPSYGDRAVGLELLCDDYQGRSYQFATTQNFAGCATGPSPEGNTQFFLLFLYETHPERATYEMPFMCCRDAVSKSVTLGSPSWRFGFDDKVLLRYEPASCEAGGRIWVLPPGSQTCSQPGV